MATIDYFGDQSGGHPSRRNVNGVYVRKVTIDFADVLTKKGSALAASDEVVVTEVPAGTLVLGGGLNVTTALDASAVTLNMGVNGADTLVDGVDATSTGYAAAGTNGNTALGSAARQTSATTIDITVATLTGTLAAGVVDAYVIMADLT